MSAPRTSALNPTWMTKFHHFAGCSSLFSDTTSPNPRDAFLTTTLRRFQLQALSPTKPPKRNKRRDVGTRSLRAHCTGYRLGYLGQHLRIHHFSATFESTGTWRIFSIILGEFASPLLNDSDLAEISIEFRSGGARRKNRSVRAEREGNDCRTYYEQPQVASKSEIVLSEMHV